MKFTTIAALASLSLSKFALADSPEFGLLIIHSGSRIQNSFPAVDGDKLVINGKPTESAVITDDGKLKFGSQYITVDSNNELVVVADASSAVSGFSIADGRLAYSKNFYAAPSGNGQDSYNLFVGTSTTSDDIDFVVSARSSDGGVAPDFTPGQEPAAPTSSAVVVTQTDNGAAQNAAGLGAVLAMGAALLL